MIFAQMLRCKKSYWMFLGQWWCDRVQIELIIESLRIYLFIYNPVIILI